MQRFKRGYQAIRRPALPQDAAYTLSLPSPLGGAPLCRATISISSARHADGESVRLRAHVDGCLPRVRARDLTALPGENGGSGLVAFGRHAARGLIRRGLSGLPARLTERRLRSWFDFRLNTTPLASGAEALLPERLRELCGGGLPQGPDGAPRMGVWSGPTDGLGSARLALLQIDQDDLPAAADGHPFNLVASLATVIEPEPGGGGGD